MEKTREHDILCAEKSNFKYMYTYKLSQKSSAQLS